MIDENNTWVLRITKYFVLRFEKNGVNVYLYIVCQPMPKRITIPILTYHFLLSFKYHLECYCDCRFAFKLSR